MNRERSNVGRGAYSDRVKTILTACRSTAVAGPLAEDLNGYAAGRLHDELAWRDVALHACRVLQTNEKVIFVTPWQMAAATAQMRYAQDDGYRIVVVPDDIARSLGSLTDLNGKPLVDLGRYRDEWNDSFSFTFVDPAVMTSAEQAVYARTREIAALLSSVHSLSADMRASLGLLGIRQRRAEQGDLCSHAHGRHGCSMPVVPKRGRIGEVDEARRDRPPALGALAGPAWLLATAGPTAAASRSPRGGSSGWRRSGWARLSRGMQPPAPADLTRR